MDERDLMRLHVETLFTHDTRGRLVRVNEPNGREAPRFLLGRTSAGNEWRVRHNLDDDLVKQLAVLSTAAGGADLDTSSQSAFEAILSPVRGVWAGPAYRFPKDLASPSDAVLVTRENIDLLRPLFADWIPDLATGQPFAAVVRDGRAVSVCYSPRFTATAYEAGVETHPDYRGHGYASLAVSAWATAVARMGGIPLYSTSWTNTASQAVASRLGLVRFGADLHIT